VTSREEGSVRIPESPSCRFRTPLSSPRGRPDRSTRVQFIGPWFENAAVDRRVMHVRQIWRASWRRQVDTRDRGPSHRARARAPARSRGRGSARTSAYGTASAGSRSTPRCSCRMMRFALPPRPWCRGDAYRLKHLLGSLMREPAAAVVSVTAVFTKRCAPASADFRGS